MIETPQPRRLGYVGVSTYEQTLSRRADWPAPRRRSHLALPRDGERQTSRSRRPRSNRRPSPMRQLMRSGSERS